MNIEEELLAEHSKKQTIKIVNWIGNNTSRLQTFMDLYLLNEPITTQRGSMVTNHIFINEPEILIPYLEKMTSLLNQDVHDAVKRCTMRILSEIEIPEKIEGLVLNKAFEYFSAGEIPIAIRVHAMQVVFNLIPKYPELKNEFVATINMQLINGSAGFKSRANKLLKKLDR
jgi:hypothetical protein